MGRGKKFLEQLYDEKEMHKEHRHKHLLYKLSFVTALFGLGTLGIEMWDLRPLIYLVPFVALCHDIYIFAEDYKVKRIGLFIKSLGKGYFDKIPPYINQDYLSSEIKENLSQIEVFWEEWLKSHREKWAYMASFIITVLATLSSAMIIIADLFKKYDCIKLLIFCVWILIVIIGIILIFIYCRSLRKEVKEFDEVLRK